MKISAAEVAKIATLARLQLSDGKLELFAHQMGDILGYMEQLNGLDTTGVEPLYSPVDHPTPLRQDKVVQPFTREDILSNAPEEDGRFFIVPKIV